MKRTASRALVAALVTALALSGAVMAKGHPSHGPKADQGTTTGQADKAAKAASLKTKGNASHPGGVFRVLAIVKAGPADRPATVDAIVHFATGDVAVVLTRSGGGSAYHGNVPVPATEPAGTVLIDATAVVLTVTLKATGSGKIVKQKAGLRHNLEKKASKVTRRLSGTVEVAKVDLPRIKKLLGR